MDLCDFIYENPVEACDKLIAMYNERGETIKALHAELKQKDEKLSEFQNGLPIEKAKEFAVYNVAYVHIDNDVRSVGYQGCVALKHNEKMRFYPLPDKESFIPETWVVRLYPLPSTETAIKEGE